LSKKKSDAIYPQNSSTLSKVMTSFNKSAQFSLGPVALGVLVNQRVQVFMRGCLTLKFLGSWKTVRGSYRGSYAVDGGDESLLSMARFAIDCVGGTGEATSVIAKYPTMSWMIDL
jgi:hypothetical protein